jgi:hypothetical protein
MDCRTNAVGDLGGKCENGYGRQKSGYGQQKMATDSKKVDTDSENCFRSIRNVNTKDIKNVVWTHSMVIVHV